MQSRRWNSQSKYLLQETILFFLFAYPLIYAGQHAGVQFYPTALVSTLLVTLTGLAWIAWRLRKRRPFPRTEIDLPLAALLCAWAVSTLFSADPRRSLMIFTQLLAYTLMFYLLVDLMRAGWRAELVVKVLLILSAFEVLFGGLQLTNWYRGWLDIAGWENPIPLATLRIHGTFNHPNMLAVFLYTALLLGLSRLAASKTRWKQAFLGSWSVLLLFLLYMTSSRAGWLGAAAGLMALGSLLALEHRDRILPIARRILTHKTLLLAGLAALLVLAWVGIGLVSYQVSHPSHGGSRAGFWSVAWQAFRQSPLTGLGLFTYGAEFMRAYEVPPQGLFVHAHNYWLHTLAESGLLGLGALLWTGAALVLAIARRRRRLPAPQRPLLAGATACLAAVAVHSIFDTPQFVPPMNFLLAVVLALALGPKPQLQERRSARPWRLALPVLAGLALALLWLPLPAQRLHYQGVQAAHQGDWQAAGDKLDQAAENDPHLALYWFQAGFAHGMRALNEDGSTRDPQELQTALAHYARGLQLEPVYPVNWANLAALHWAGGDREAPLSALEEAYRQSPSVPAFALTLGAYYEAESRAPEAAAVYRQALSLNPSLRASPFFRQSALRRQTAAAFLASRPAPPSQEAQAWAAFEAGDAPKAQALFEPLTGLNTASAHLGLGLALLEQGQLEPARRALQIAAFQSGSLQSQLALGKVYEQLDQPQMAIRHYETVRNAVEATGVWGAGQRGNTQYSGLLFLRDGLPADLLPGFELGQSTGEVLEGMADLARLYRLTGQSEAAQQLEAKLIAVGAATGAQ